MNKSKAAIIGLGVATLSSFPASLSLETMWGMVWICSKCKQRSVVTNNTRCRSCGGAMKPKGNGYKART